MPYACSLVGNSWHLTKADGTGEILGTHKLKRECTQQMRAIYANELSRPENIIFNGMIDNLAVPDFDYRVATAKDEVHVVIDSEGGDFLDAIGMHQKLRNSGKRVITHVNPKAFSAAAVLALAGDRVIMPENGLLKFHGVSIEPRGAKNADELQKMADGLKAANEILVNTIMSKCKKDKVYCEELVNKEAWLTADEAKHIGLIDEIMPIFRDVQIQNYFPERIVNFVQEKEKMPLKELLDQFGVSDETALVALVTELRANQKPKPIVVGESLINMLKKARETEVNALVAGGKVNGVVAADLKTKFITDERIRNDASTGNEEFENIVTSHSKNERIINFDPKTGAQVPGTGKLEKPDPTAEDNVLVDNMKSRKNTA